MTGVHNMETVSALLFARTSWK